MANVTRGRGSGLWGIVAADAEYSAGGLAHLQIAVAIVVLLLLLWSTTSIPTGNVGVLTLFGRVTGETLPEGIHLINPLKSVQKLSVQTQSVKESANVPSNEGLILALDTSLLFRLDKSKAAYVYQTVGDNYAEKIVETDAARGDSRGDFGAHGERAVHQCPRTGAGANSRGVDQRTGAARGDCGKRAAARRATAGHAERFDRGQAASGTGRLAHELHFAERKARSGAQAHRSAGHRGFSEIVAQGISPQLLEWKGIEATEKLATSSNSKVVIIGNPKNGLPLVLEPR